MLDYNSVIREYLKQVATFVFTCDNNLTLHEMLDPDLMLVFISK